MQRCRVTWFALITRVAIESLRWANFAHGFPSSHTLHTERRPSPFDVVRTKASTANHPLRFNDPNSLRKRKGNRQKGRDRCVQFDLNGILQAWPGRILQAVGCLTCQVNRRQPYSRSLNRRFSCSSTDTQRSAVSARRVLIRDIILRG